MQHLSDVPLKRVRRSKAQINESLKSKGIVKLHAPGGRAEYKCTVCKSVWLTLESAEAHTCRGGTRDPHTSCTNTRSSSPFDDGNFACGSAQALGKEDQILQALQQVVDLLQSDPHLLGGADSVDPAPAVEAVTTSQARQGVPVSEDGDVQGRPAAGISLPSAELIAGGAIEPPTDPQYESISKTEAATVDECGAARMVESTEREYQEKIGDPLGEGFLSFIGRARGGLPMYESSDNEADEVADVVAPPAPVPLEGQPPAAEVQAGPAMAAEAVPAGAAVGANPDADDQGPAADPGADAAHACRRRPRIGTGEWFKQNRDNPITPQSSVTIVQACHWLATLKSDCRMTDEAVDKICLMVNKFVLPEGNFFPPSYHLVKATLGVTASKACTEHICDKCWSVFPHMEADEFQANAAQTCQASGIAGCQAGICGNPRFNTSDTGVTVPRRCLYQFNITETVCDLLEVVLGDLQAVVDKRLADFLDSSTLWGSPAGRQLDAACGFLFSNPRPGEIAIAFAFGGDGAQVFLNRVYGVMVCGLRLVDSPPGTAAKNVTWAPVNLVQGPTEPKSMHGVIAEVLAFFKRHDPGRPGSTPLEVTMKDGSILKVWPVLSHAEGDIPFMTKLTNSVAHTAAMACFHCAIVASYCMAARTNRWLGYYRPLVQCMPCQHQTGRLMSDAELNSVDWSGSKPRMVRGYIEDDPWGPAEDVRMASTAPVALQPNTWVTDNVLKWTALEKLCRGHRAKQLEAQVMNPTLPELVGKTEAQREKIIDDKMKDLGVRGEPLFSGLSYFNPSHFFRLGIAHVFLLGLLKDFWNHWLQPVKNAWTEYILPSVLRAFITSRGEQLQLTELFGKPYTDLIKYRGCWMMEEWLAFTETFALYLLQDLPWPAGSEAVRLVFEEQWSLLRPAVLYFMKYEQGQHTEERIHQAQGWLLSYGRSAEKVFKGRSLTTFKLHLAAAHLGDQVRACGAGFFSTEFWIERMVQVLKRMIKYRSTAFPELLFVHDWLLVLACRRVRRTEEGKNLTTLEEALEILRAAKRKVHDEPDDAGTMLLGAPHPVTDEEKAEVLPQYEPPALLEDVNLSGLPKLLYHEPNLNKQNWPTFKGDPDQIRAQCIFSDIGLGGPMEEPRPADAGPRVWVELQKFRRALLPIEDAISCVQCTAQKKKNNQWGLMIWDVCEGDEITHTEMCAVHFQYLLRAQLRTSDRRDAAPRGLGLVGVLPPKAKPLKLAVAKVFTCQPRIVPGMRPLSDKSAEQLAKELPEILKLADVRPSADNPKYCGHWLVELSTINSQLVPTKEYQSSRHFMVANKSSGRMVSVKR